MGELVIGGKTVAVPFPVHHRLGRLPSRKRKAPPIHCLVHVDMSFSSLATEAILLKRGLSTHFGVDGDVVDGWATCWQWLDPIKHTGIHAGAANATSIGIDVNTPLSLKYADRDVAKRDGRKRPIIEGMARGKKRISLGLYPEQLRTVVALAQVLREHCDIPMEYARDRRGLVTDKWEDWKDWRGWLPHMAIPTTTHWCCGPVGAQVAAALDSAK